MVAAEQVDVVVTERGEPLDVGVVDGVAVAPELGEGGVEVAGVLQHNGVEDQAEGAELVFLAFPVAPGGVRDRAISVTVLLPEGRHQAGGPPRLQSRGCPGLRGT